MRIPFPFIAYTHDDLCRKITDYYKSFGKGCRIIRRAEFLEERLILLAVAVYCKNEILQEDQSQRAWVSTTQCGTSVRPLLHGAWVRRAAWERSCWPLVPRTWDTVCPMPGSWYTSLTDMLGYVSESGSYNETPSLMATPDEQPPSLQWRERGRWCQVLNLFGRLLDR